MADPSLPWVDNRIAQTVLADLQVAYPIVLLLLYIIAFSIRSIATARSDDDSSPQPEQYGPGGKPLPKKHVSAKERDMANPHTDFSWPRKLLFQWLSVAVVACLGADIVVVIVHAIVERKAGWWCGQSPTVRTHPSVASRRFASAKR